MQCNETCKEMNLTIMLLHFNIIVKFCFCLLLLPCSCVYNITFAINTIVRVNPKKCKSQAEDSLDIQGNLGTMGIQMFVCNCAH